MLTSVWEGDDASFLVEAIPFYLRRESGRIVVLDATWGNGLFWAAAPGNWRIVGMDNSPSKRAALLADNRNMPIRAESVDVVAYDPPHVTHSWSEWSQSGSYGVAAGYDSIAYLFPQFLDEAERVLKPDGIVIAKLADQVHSGQTFLQTCEFVDLAKQQFAVCDLIVKVRSGFRPQPDGRRQLHARRRHSFYVILRKGRC